MNLRDRLGFSAILIFTLFLFGSDALVARTNNSSSRLFPTPESLKPNVEFWKNIYAKYSERDVVIHDSYDLSIVYEVVNMDSLFRGINVSERLQWKKIERIKKGYKSILRKLSRKKKLRIESLRGKERYVASLFNGELTSKRLLKASRNIRGQNGLRERFRLGLQRSGLYLPYMKKIFQEANLPLELLAIPHVESSFNYKAYSKFGAAGIWQFTRSTGRSYMKINYEVDERLDPIRATESAALHLKRNHEKLRSWPLAVTAYNHGRNGMIRAKKKFGDNIGRIVKYYRSGSFGFASRNFYSEFLAALHITQNHRDYFGEIEFHKARDFISFNTPHYIKVSDLTSKLDISLKEFAEFNPAFRPSVINSKRRIPKDFPIRVPYRSGLDIQAVYAQIPANVKYTDQIRAKWHKVRSGENLSRIARKYRVSLGELMGANNIRNSHRIYVGQNLQIPAGRGAKQVPISIVMAETSQLAEMPDLSKTDKVSVLDVPQTFRVVKSNAYEAADKPSFAMDPVTSVSPKPKREERVIKKDKTLTLIEIKKLENQVETVEEVMAMALPNHYVELTRSMGTRVVKAPVVEVLHESFRDIALPENGQVTIEPDETLGHFADWLDVPTQTLRRVNRFSYGQAIQLGQLLWLTFQNVTPEEFHRRRLEYHQGIEEDFYGNFIVEGQTIHKVRRGESIWVLCNNTFEVPYWLLKKHNPNKALLNLAAGDEIVVPLVEARDSGAILNN
ncbi:transglycosylase SLT domain-containing protein [candidate division KSB1 bacterium]|nr:transglycosylase SLT domain-containing protein [candidate division KSB1 bacterium]